MTGSIYQELSTILRKYMNPIIVGPVIDTAMKKIGVDSKTITNDVLPLVIVKMIKDERVKKEISSTVKQSQLANDLINYSNNISEKVSQDDIKFVKNISVSGTGNKTAVIVEDSEEFIEILTLYMKDMNIDVLGNPSGSDSITFIKGLYDKGHIPDIVTMDILMPGMDGIACSTELKLMNRNIKIIAITGLLDKELDEMVGNGPFDYLLRKPVRFEDVKEAVEKTMK